MATRRLSGDRHPRRPNWWLGSFRRAGKPPINNPDEKKHHSNHKRSDPNRQLPLQHRHLPPQVMGCKENPVCQKAVANFATHNWGWCAQSHLDR